MVAGHSNCRDAQVGLDLGQDVLDVVMDMPSRHRPPQPRSRVLDELLLHGVRRLDQRLKLCATVAARRHTTVPERR